MYFAQEPNKMYRVVYEYSPEKALPIVTQVDTLFYHRSTLIRNITGSYADTLVELKRSELKIYSQKELTKEGILNFVDEVSNNKATLNSFRKDSEGRSIIFLFSYAILGLFVGVIFHLWKNNRLPQGRK